MSVPGTRLDTRFSDADAVATSWNDTRQALEKAELFWITTVRRDGRPHTTPLVAVWLDDAMYLCTGPSEQKAVNLTPQPVRRPDHRVQRMGTRNRHRRRRHRGQSHR
jgi:predicted pyridoxine 5'-phosphate oxidase superfamily flavin-nucleotide-binding protein